MKPFVLVTLVFTSNVKPGFDSSRLFPSYLISCLPFAYPFKTHSTFLVHADCPNQTAGVWAGSQGLLLGIHDSKDLVINGGSLNSHGSSFYYN